MPGLVIRGVDHCDGIPWAAIQEGPFRALGCALAATNTLQGIHLDDSEGGGPRVLHEDHALIDRAIGLADWSSGAASAGLSYIGEHLGLFFALLGISRCHSYISP